MFVSGEGEPEIFAAVLAGRAHQATSGSEVATFLTRARIESADSHAATDVLPARAVQNMADQLEHFIDAAKQRAFAFSLPAAHAQPQQTTNP